MRLVKIFTAGLALSVSLLLAAAPARSAEPQLVRDIEPRGPRQATVFTGIDPIATVNGRTFFRIYSTGGIDPSGLWTSDGSLAGTVFLSPEIPAAGDQGILPVATTRRLVYYLIGSRAPGKYQLWRSDGTAAGTFRLTETRALYPYSVVTLLSFGHQVAFTRCDELGCEPWITDGTVAGTRRLHDIAPGAAGSEPYSYAVFQGSLYFLASPTPGEIELWRSDGTPDGTEREAVVPARGPASFTTTRDRLYLTVIGSQPSARNLLWTHDGPGAGFRPLPPFSASSPQGPTFRGATGSSEENLYFLGSNGAGPDLWRTDGTAAGTRRILDIGDDANDSRNISPPATLRGQDFFLGPGLKLWSTRGTAATTLPVGRPCRVFCSPFLTPLQLRGGLERIGDRLLFKGLDAAGDELWASDGTAAGTGRLADLCPGPCSGDPRLVGRGPRGIYVSTLQGELWISDGTPAGTINLTRGQAGAAIAPLAAPAALSAWGALPASGPDGEKGGEKTDEPEKVDAVLAFAYFHPFRGAEIWRSDGTPEGTYPLRKVGNGGSSNPAAITALGDGVVFRACNRTQGAIWSSHGQAADTVPIFYSSPCDLPVISEPAFLTRDGAAFFTLSFPSAQSPEVWRTDGTRAGTRVLASFADEYVDARLISADFQGGLLQLRGSGQAGPRLLRIDPANGTATLVADLGTDYLGAVAATPHRVFYIQAQIGGTPGVRHSLWTANGSPGGTVRLFDFPPPSVVGQPLEAIEVGTTTYLRFGHGSGYQIWRTDGSPAGTSKLYPPLETPGQPEPYQLVPLGDAILLLTGLAGSPEVPLSLLRSDGTAEGTVTLRTFPGIEEIFTEPKPGVVLDGVFYFVVGTAESGEELWRTDGTAEGTVLVRDIGPGDGSSGIQGLTVTGGRLVFSANDGVHGTELWTSDGTAAGTRMAGDVAPGAYSSSPWSFAAAGPWLYFSADDGVHGRELWKVAIDPAGAATSAIAPLRARP